MHKYAGWLLLIVFIGFLWFCTYAYKLRTNFNVDEISDENSILQTKVEMLSYAIKIVPEEVKNDVFFNSVMEKYSSIDKKEYRDIYLLIISEKKKEQEEKMDKKVEELKEKESVPSVAQAMDNMLPN